MFLGIGLWWAFQCSYQMWILGMGPSICIGSDIINSSWSFPFLYPAGDLILPFVPSREVVVQRFTFLLGCKCHEELTALWCSRCITRRPEGPEGGSYPDGAEDFSDRYHHRFHPPPPLEERRWAGSADHTGCAVPCCHCHRDPASQLECLLNSCWGVCLFVFEKWYSIATCSFVRLPSTAWTFGVFWLWFGDNPWGRWENGEAGKCSLRLLFFLHVTQRKVVGVQSGLKLEFFL